MKALKYNPKNTEEAAALEAECQLSGEFKPARCPDCGNIFIAGTGHVGSDFCKVQSVLKSRAEQGYVRCHLSRVPMLERLGISYETDFGALEQVSGFYRGQKGKDCPFIEEWVSDVFFVCKTKSVKETEHELAFYRDNPKLRHKIRSSEC
jgi:hypothetical protein